MHREYGVRRAVICYVLLVLGVWALVIGSMNRVTVQMGNKRTTYYTFAPTVRDVLREVGINGVMGLNRGEELLAEGQAVKYLTVSRSLDSRIQNMMKIRVFQNEIHKTVSRDIVPAPVRRTWDIFLEDGKQRIADNGQDGLLKSTFVLRYRDGVLVSRSKVSSRLLIAPRPKVIKTGSYKEVVRQPPVSRGRPAGFIATAYTYTGRRTAIGAVTRRGIVAVDPRVIRMGTKMYIEGYGYGIAADTGGAIKGRKIDLFFETRQAALKWGRRQVKVTILS